MDQRYARQQQTLDTIAKTLEPHARKINRYMSVKQNIGCLCDVLGIDYSHELEHNDLNSRQLRKRVISWCNEEPERWAVVHKVLGPCAVP